MKTPKPPKMAESRLNCYLPYHLHAAIRQQAASEMITSSALLRRAAKRYLDSLRIDRTLN